MLRYTLLKMPCHGFEYIYITDLSGIDFEWIEIGSVTLDELSGRDNS